MAGVSPSVEAAPSWKKNVLLATFLGTTVESYDCKIYGIAAALVFGPHCFPKRSETASTIAAFATRSLRAMSPWTGTQANSIGIAICWRICHARSRRSGRPYPDGLARQFPSLQPCSTVAVEIDGLSPAENHIGEAEMSVASEFGAQPTAPHGVLSVALGSDYEA
jgi:hypothetical protein